LLSWSGVARTNDPDHTLFLVDQLGALLNPEVILPAVHVEKRFHSGGASAHVSLRRRHALGVEPQIPQLGATNIGEAAQRIQASVVRLVPHFLNRLVRSAIGIHYFANDFFRAGYDLR